MPLLFAYGTLRDAPVQRSLFGRLVAGAPDVLTGWAEGTVRLSGRPAFVYADARDAARADDRRGA